MPTAEPKTPQPPIWPPDGSTVNLTRVEGAGKGFTASQLKMEVHSESHSGPLPSAATLRSYEEVMTGAADRVFTMAEEQQRHIQAMDMRAMELTAADRKRGQAYGLAAAVAAFITVGVCAYFGESTVASIVGGSTTLGIVGIFVIGKLVQVGGRSRDDDDDDDVDTSGPTSA